MRPLTRPAHLAIQIALATQIYVSGQVAPQYLTFTDSLSIVFLGCISLWRGPRTALFFLGSYVIWRDRAFLPYWDEVAAWRGEFRFQTDQDTCLLS